MKILFEAAFAKDLKRLKDKQTRRRISQIIDAAKSAETLTDLPNLKKIQGHTTFYRIRIGGFRLGLEVVDDTLIFVRALHRKDIYRRFP